LTAPLFTKMKVLVTGATGGLGTLVCENLINLGCTVIATSRNPEKAKSWELITKVKYIAYDFSHKSEKNLFEYFEKPDTVIHLAWDKLNNYRAPEHLSKLLDEHKNFLTNLIINGCNNISVTGTCYEYGLQSGELEEHLPSEPGLPYPEAKNLLRIYLQDLKSKYEFQLKWIRIFYVFGEIKDRVNLYTHLLKAVHENQESFNMSGGEQIRDFLSPKEIARNIVKISLQTCEDGIINCCSGKPVILKDFIKTFLHQNNYSIKLNLGVFPYPDYEPMECWGSVKKLQKAINCKISFKFDRSSQP
jgi:nucleoside-diphosphate-sugar epimerase